MNSTDIETYVEGSFVLHRVKLTILLLLQIPAIALSLVIFIFFTQHLALLKASQNHGLIILLTVNFIELLSDMPLSVHFYRRGYVAPAVPTYCTWWTFIALTISTTGGYLVATISLQRHIFSFKPHMLRTRWMQIILIKLPLAASTIYPLLFYLAAIILYPCDGSQWDYTSRWCGFADCYLLFDKSLGSFDLFFNACVPMLVDLSANTILIVRVFRQKRRVKKTLKWRQQRRMMLQLFCLSSLFLIGWTPSVVIQIINVVYAPTFLYEIQTNYFLDLMYIVYLFLPWTYLGFFPELKEWIGQQCRCRQVSNTVRPIAMPLEQRRVTNKIYIR